MIPKSMTYFQRKFEKLVYIIIMDRLRNKLESYSVQIRRTERERMKHQMRQKIIESIAFDEVFEEFIAHKPHQVSKQFLEEIKTASCENLKKLNDCLHEYRVVFFQSEKIYPDDWFFGCTDKNNLKLVTFLGENLENASFVHKFYKNTIAAHQKYQQITYKFELETLNSRCAIRPLKVTLNELPEQSLLSAIYDNRNEEDFLATLEFWSVILKRSEVNSIGNHIIMIKTFLLWYEHTDIHKYRETYSFLAQTIQMIFQSKIFQSAKSKPQIDLRNISQLLLDRIKRTIPYALNNLPFEEIGQTLIYMLQLTPEVPGLLPDLQYRLQTIIVFLKKQFQLGLEEDNFEYTVTAIRLVFYLMKHSVILNYCPIIDAKIILRHLIGCLFSYKLQFYALLALIELMETDLVNRIKETLQEINFKKLITQMIPECKAFLYQFFNLILVNCKENRQIQATILDECEFVDRLAEFGQASQSEDNYALFKQFVWIVDSNMAYFVDNWVEHVHKTVQYVQNIDFKGKQCFLRESQKYLELKHRESAL